LESLARQTIAHRAEAILVDDGSTDQTPEIARRFAPLVTVIRNAQSAGPGAARNRGVRAARAPVLAFTDADCFPVPEWLERGLAALDEADLIQGRVEPDPSVPRTPFDRSLAVERDGGFYQTANLFVRREWFDAVGGFRDWALDRSGRRRWTADRRRARAVRTPIGEDTLFAWQARRLGARTAFAAEALVHHEVVPGTLRDALADRWHWTRDMPGLARRVPELRQAVFYRQWFFAAWSAQADLALAGAGLAALTRRKLWLAATVPYVRRLWREAATYQAASSPGEAALSPAASHLLGQPVVDAVTFAGFAVGTIEWRSLVL